MLKSIFLRLGLVAMVFLVAHEAAGGKLSDLDKEVSKKSAAKADKKKEKKESKSHSSNSISTSSFGSGSYPSSGGGESFLGGFWSWLVVAPLQYRHDDPAASISRDEGEEGWAASGGRSIFPKHILGQATVPYVRVDYNRQSVDSEIDANDVRVEVGYKLVAFHARTTMFSDETDRTDFNQYYGVLRYGGYRPGFLPGTFEFSLGLGVAQIGDDKDTSGALTIPLKYHPTDWFGIEFRPAWYRWKDLAVGDYDISASLGYRFVQLRGGYRWLGIEDVDIDLNGPYAGVSVSF